MIAPVCRTVDVAGPVNYVELEGRAGGPTFVCVHGLGGSHLNWMGIAPALARYGRVLALDLVGHGLTPVGRREAGIGGHRRLLEGFLDRLTDRPVVLLGNSMGGLVSALVASSEPGAVAGLVLVDPALPVMPPGKVHPAVVANALVCAVPGVGERYLAHRRRIQSPEASVRRVLAACCVDVDRVDPELVAAHVALTARMDRAAADAAYLASARSLSRFLLRPRACARALDRIRVPVLLLQGDADRLVPVSTAIRLGASRPEWRLAVAGDVGHVPMMEVPEWTVERISEWLVATDLVPRAAFSAD